VIGRIITQWGTSNSTAGSGTKLRKRSGFDGSSTGVWFDTNVFTSFMQQFAERFNAAYNAVLNLDTLDCELCSHADCGPLLMCYICMLVDTNLVNNNDYGPGFV
jgi:hypothetical protein